MILIVDAYNILKQVIRDTLISESERLTFVKQMGVYAKKKGHKIIVVFDGGVTERPTQDLMRGVYVVYAGVHQTADEYIKDYIERHQHHELLLISSDRGLGSWAKRYGVQSLDSPAFYRLMISAVQKIRVGSPTTHRLVKTTDAENAEVDTLMQEGVGRFISKSESTDLHRVRASHTVSKRDKVMVKKIRKL